MLDTWCFALYCATPNARGAIFLGSLASELADSLCVDYPAQAKNMVGMTVAVEIGRSIISNN